MSDAEGAPVREGDVLAGKYRVERVLGVGGMGVVVAATHLQLDQRVALKFLLPSALRNPEVVARFAREARAAAKIQSEHVARVIDVGTLEIAGAAGDAGMSGSPYMVMEYLEGSDLAQVLETRGRLPIAEAAGHLLQACEALAEAHSVGIVHRDLKPANIFLARRPGRGDVVKVLDFGISKVTSASGSDDAALTKTSSLMGSPLYMSPEQLMSSKGVDSRSDVWALGVILYELLAGTPPFLGDTVPELVTRILHAPHRPLLHERADVPATLDALISRCLEKDPARRFPDVAAFARALAPHASARAGEVSLERISRVLGSAATAPPPPGTVTATVGTPTVSMANAWGSTNIEIPRRSPTAAIAVGAIALALIAGGGYWVFGRPTSGRPDSADHQVPEHSSQAAQAPQATQGTQGTQPTQAAHAMPEPRGEGATTGNKAEPTTSAATTVTTDAVTGTRAPALAGPAVAASPKGPRILSPPAKPSVSAKPVAAPPRATAPAAPTTFTTPPAPEAAPKKNPLADMAPK